MAYDANIPQPNDLLSQSQIQILGNFQGIGTLLSPDTGAVTFPAGGDTATNATTVALYSKIDNGTAQLFYRPVNSGTPIDVSYAPNAITGWTYLMSGLLIKWHSAGINGGATDTVNLNAIGPAYTTWVNPQVSITGMAGDTNGIYLQSVAINQIVIYRANNAGLRTYYLFTIGM